MITQHALPTDIPIMQALLKRGHDSPDKPMRPGYIIGAVQYNRFKSADDVAFRVEWLIHNGYIRREEQAEAKGIWITEAGVKELDRLLSSKASAQHLWIDPVEQNKRLDTLH